MVLSRECDEFHCRSAWYQSADRAAWDQQGSKITASLDAFRQPLYRGLFLYILRPEAGTGDTIDRWYTRISYGINKEWTRMSNSKQRSLEMNNWLIGF